MRIIELTEADQMNQDQDLDRPIKVVVDHVIMFREKQDGENGWIGTSFVTLTGGHTVEVRETVREIQHKLFVG